MIAENAVAVSAWLQQNGYMKLVKGRFVTTRKFNLEVLGEDGGLVELPGGMLKSKTGSQEPVLTTSDWQDLYMRFIIESEVPKMIHMSDGTVYEANKFSDAGLKAFRAALDKEKKSYDILVLATQMYYRDQSKARQIIGNYMSKGAWRTDYEAVALLHAAGIAKNDIVNDTAKRFSATRLG